MATERIVVHSSIAQPFIKAFQQSISTFFPSSGPAPVLVTPAGVRKNHALVSSALSSGAKSLYGDVNAKEDSDTRMRPIVVEGVKKDMDLYYTESFGPSVSLFVVESEEEAIALANDTEYGLSCAVFTESLQAGLRVAKAVESGAVHINSMTIHDEPNLPHGGVKKSGFGRFNGNAGLEEFLKMKTVTWNDE
jgi:acyl-CoA reductase-like NAD-dependent aldehyde dehydrogenase